jgi:hypothetical protein
MNFVERENIYVSNSILLHLRISFIGFKESSKPIPLHSPTINLFQGVMRRVLHMARCTNVATFEILPLHSEVVRGIVKDDINIVKKPKR